MRKTMDGRKDFVARSFRGWPTSILLAGVLALGFAASAQEDGDRSAAPPAQAPQTPRTEAPAPGPRGQAQRPADDEDDVFVPTEEIGADEEVVFPVDI